MADIAAIFGWTPADMDAMGLAEIAEWRSRARARSGAES